MFVCHAATRRLTVVMGTTCTYGSNAQHSMTDRRACKQFQNVMQGLHTCYKPVTMQERRSHSFSSLLTLKGRNTLIYGRF